MSDSSIPPPSADTGEALTRMANYGKRERSGWGPLVLVGVLLIPLAAVGWVAWRQMALQGELAALRTDNATLQQMSGGTAEQVAEVEQRQQALDTSLQQQVQQALEQERATSDAALTAQSEQIAALESELTALDSELEETRLRLNSMEGGGSPLTEAEVLLRFAQQRLVLARDTETAIELFRAADDTLRDTVDPAIVNVRESLAREIATLQALPTVDVPGLFARLSALAARIDSFTVASDATAQDFTVTPAGVEPQPSSGWWNGIKQSLSEYFVVTRSTGAALPQLSSGEQFQLRALVQLHIEQAKVALLRTEPQLYQGALEDALAASRRWLRSEDNSLDEFIEALTMLRDTPIIIDIPALDQSLSALRRLTGNEETPSQTANEAPAAEPAAQ
jgi:uroporphyrin-3 C-methyltransferase